MQRAELWRRTLGRADTQGALAIGAVLLLTVGLQAIALYRYVAMETMEEADRWMIHALRVTERALDQPGSIDPAIAEVRASFGDLLPSIRLTNGRGEVLSRWGEWPAAQQVVAASKSDDNRGFDAHRLLRGENYLVGDVRVSAGVAEVAMPLSHFAGETAEVGQGLALVAILSGSVALLIAIATTARAFSPLRRATDAIRDIDSRPLGSRLETRSTGDPIDRHAEEVNRVLANIEASVSRMREFSSDAAHELRTPLNRISNVAEVALLDPGESELRPALEAIRKTAVDLSRMVQSLLLLAEIDDRRLEVRASELDLDEWITRVAETYAPLFEEGSVNFETRSRAGMVAADRSLLDRVLLNLVENALRHSRSGDRVRIEGDRSAKGVTISVDDSGPGIPMEQRERVFERFARLEPRTGPPGSGLGLALARAIARLLGGDLSIGDSSLGGTRFVWSLPLRPSSGTSKAARRTG